MLQYGEAYFFFVSRRIASRIHEISDLEKKVSCSALGPSARRSHIRKNALNTRGMLKLYMIWSCVRENGSIYLLSFTVAQPDISVYNVFPVRIYAFLIFKCNVRHASKTPFRVQWYPKTTPSRVPVYFIYFAFFFLLSAAYTNPSQRKARLSFVFLYSATVVCTGCR